jgi:hypothetical protein
MAALVGLSRGSRFTRFDGFTEPNSATTPGIGDCWEPGSIPGTLDPAAGPLEEGQDFWVARPEMELSFNLKERNHPTCSVAAGCLRRRRPLSPWLCPTPA